MNLADLGAIYSKADRPPTGNGKLAKMDFEGGLSIDVDKATGSNTSGTNPDGTRR